MFKVGSPAHLSAPLPRGAYAHIDGGWSAHLYDAQGRLVDVWQPAVTEADPASPTHNQSLRPQWAYADDTAGNLASQADPNGDTTAFAYDEKARAPAGPFDLAGNRVLRERGTTLTVH